MIIFNPTGPLDIASDASDLDQGGQGNTVQSGALTRCKNMRVSRRGMAETRHGSAIINASAIETPIYLITVMAGDRYEFAGTQIYQNEVSIDTGLTSAQWSASAYSNSGGRLGRSALLSLENPELIEEAVRVYGDLGDARPDKTIKRVK